jgi:hypothetical protein
MFEVMFAISFSQKPSTGDNTTPDAVAVVAVADDGHGGVVVAGCVLLWEVTNCGKTLTHKK